MYVLPSHRNSLVEDGKRSPPARDGIMVSHSRPANPVLPGFRVLLRHMFKWEYVNRVWGARLAIATLGIVAAVLDSCGALPYP